MYVQYRGFDTEPYFRIYTFHVIDTPRKARDFTVKIHSEAFRKDRLSLQDGPGICYACLTQELQARTSEPVSGACLSVAERDIDAYIEQHHPKTPQGKRNS